MAKPDYDTTLARIAGNILSGLVSNGTRSTQTIAPPEVALAVSLARAIVDEIRRTTPTADTVPRRVAGTHAKDCPAYGNGSYPYKPCLCGGWIE